MEASAGTPNHPLFQTGNLKRRLRVNRLIETASTIAAILAVAVLGIVVGYVAVRGVGSINLDFLTKVPATFGESGGGIANAIVGTLLLIGMATVAAVPLGLLIAIYTSEFAGPRLGNAVRFGLDILNGVPTIVTGIFVYIVLVLSVIGHQSAIAGATALAIIMLPIVARTAQEVLALVPGTLKEGAYALGLSRWRTVLRVVLPTAAPGLITGSLLGVARVAGETAPLLFTSVIAPPGVSTDVSNAVASIPTTIFQLSEQPSPEAHSQAWAAAFLLIIFILVLNLVARAFHARSKKRIGG